MPYPITMTGRRIWYAPWRRRPSLTVMHADTVPLNGKGISALLEKAYSMHDQKEATGFTIGEGFSTPAGSAWQPGDTVAATEGPFATDGSTPDMSDVETDGALLERLGTDAESWTVAFMDVACFANPLGKALRGFPHDDRETLADIMRGWFANAIEAGRSAGYAAARELDPGTIHAFAHTTAAPAGEADPFPAALRFRKLPVTIEAVRFLKVEGTGQIIFGVYPAPEWLIDACGGPEGQPGSIWASMGTLLIGTLEGSHLASPGDWIIRGVKGEVYPCKPDIFAETYEAEEPATIGPITLDIGAKQVFWDGEGFICDQDLPQWVLDLTALEVAGETESGPHLVVEIDGVRTLLRPGTIVTRDMFPG
jgi:hypothetical protein